MNRILDLYCKITRAWLGCRSRLLYWLRQLSDVALPMATRGRLDARPCYWIFDGSNSFPGSFPWIQRVLRDTACLKKGDHHRFTRKPRPSEHFRHDGLRQWGFAKPGLLLQLA